MENDEIKTHFNETLIGCLKFYEKSWKKLSDCKQCNLRVGDSGSKQMEIYRYERVVK